MKSISLYTKISSLPENLERDVDDFVDFSINKEKCKKGW